MLYPDLIAIAKSLTDQGSSDQGGTAAELLLWLQGMFPPFVRKISKVAPEFYMVVSTGGLPHGGMTLGYNEVRKVEVLQGTQYVTLPRVDRNVSGTSSRMSWDLLNTDIAIYPEALTTGSFRVTYIPEIPLPASNVQLPLPAGFEWCLIYDLAVLIRQKTDQDAAFFERRSKESWSESVASISPRSSFPQAISDYDGTGGLDWPFTP